ncbi:MAG: hypothetical protein WHT06_15950 [Desulfobacterales bacterium]
MVPLLDLIAVLGGIVIPPAFDFLKKRFVKSERDTPEATISALATTKPDVLGAYIDALARLKAAEKDFFNRDVIGETARWVNNTRAIIRPAGVVVSFLILWGIAAGWIENQDGVRISAEGVISTWFGSRVAIR